MDGALHRKLVEEFADIATIIDSDGTITYVSPSVTRALGYEPEELVGEVGYEYQHPDDSDAVADAIESLQANPDSTQIIQTRFRHADGSWCWIEATLQNRLDDPDINGILVNSRDISQRKRQEQQLRSQKEQLDEFASVVSHDLRNPLTVAQGRAELLANDCDSEHLSPLVESLDRMGEIIADTLTLARQGQVVSDQEPIEIVNLVGVCSKNVGLDNATIEIEDEVTITGDRSRLQHVFENLFRNAVEHGGTDVIIRVGKIDDHGIYVEDTGSGIPEDAREAVFDPGHTLGSDGAGVGLTIVKRIAEAHGWQVVVVDGDDGGARFEFTDVDID